MKHLLPLFLFFLAFGCAKERRSYEQYGPSGMTARTEALAHNLPRFDGVMIGSRYATLCGMGWAGDSARSDIQSITDDMPAVSLYTFDGLERGTSNVDGFGFDELTADVLATVRRGSLPVVEWGTSGAAGMKAKGLQTFAAAIDKRLDALHDGYGIHAPVVLALLPLDSPKRPYYNLSAAAYKALYRKVAATLTAKNCVLAFAAAPERLDRCPDSVAVVQLSLYTDQPDTAAYRAALAKAVPLLQRTAKAHHAAAAISTGMLAPTTDAYWTDIILPAAAAPGIVYAVFGDNSGSPENHHYHVPYPGSQGVPGFMKLYNNPRTRFAHDVNGLFLVN